jgi:hypothetical protein
MNIILERVNAVCNDVRNKNDGPISFKKLITQTRKSFKAFGFDIKIKTKTERSLDVDRFYVMAYYDSYDDSQGDIPIEVYVHHNLTGNEQFGEHQITNFLIEIYDATVHEYRHQHQSVQRNHEEYTEHARHPYEEYLSNSDEMDAYSLSIAIEMLRHMSKERAQKYMSRITVMSKMRKGSVYAIPVLRSYIGIFGLCPLTKKIAKKVYKHLEVIDKRHIFM